MVGQRTILPETRGELALCCTSLSSLSGNVNTVWVFTMNMYTIVIFTDIVVSGTF